LRPQHFEPPRIVQLLEQAEHYRRLLDSGEAPTRASLARAFGLTRARVTQILNLLKLHPEIQQAIRSLPNTTPRRWVTERRLRKLCQLLPDEQLQVVADVAPGLMAGLARRKAG
jgi:ParB-like chromosome segregation protein Spo0J